jgi:hypothetical protein
MNEKKPFIPYAGLTEKKVTPSKASFTNEDTRPFELKTEVKSRNLH